MDNNNLIWPLYESLYCVYVFSYARMIRNVTWLCVVLREFLRLYANKIIEAFGYLLDFWRVRKCRIFIYAYKKIMPACTRVNRQKFWLLRVRVQSYLNEIQIRQ